LCSKPVGKAPKMGSSEDAEWQLQSRKPVLRKNRTGAKTRLAFRRGEWTKAGEETSAAFGAVLFASSFPDIIENWGVRFWWDRTRSNLWIA